MRSASCGMLAWSWELAVLRKDWGSADPEKRGCHPGRQKGHRDTTSADMGLSRHCKRRDKVEGPSPVSCKKCAWRVWGGSWKYELATGESLRELKRPAPSRKANPKLATTPGTVVPKRIGEIFSISNVIKSKGKRNLRSFMDCFKVGGQWTTVHDHMHLNKDSTSTPADRPSTKALHTVKLKNNNPS